MIWVFLFLNALGVVWFWGIMPPWQGWIESDNSIPYLMAHEPWHLQDFYYWGQMRFGSLFVSVWKLFGRPFFPGPEAFYFAHALLFFNALGFWCLCFRRVWARVAFVALLLPWSVYRSTLFLLPGQPYGMLFLLQGVFFYVLLYVNRRRSLSLGLLSGLAYWQHELAGMGMVALSLYFIRLDATPRRWRSFWLGLVPWLGFSEVARQWSKQWPVVHHYSLNQWPAFLENLQFFLAQGLPFFSTPVFSLLAWWGFVVLWLAGFARGSWGQPDYRVERLLRVLPPILFFWILVVLDSRWYSLNARNPRYLTLIWPLVLFWLVLRAESTKARSGMGVVACGLVGCLAVLFYSAPVGMDLLFGGQKPLREAVYQRNLAQLEALQRDGCQSYVGPYWEATQLMVLSAGNLKVGSPDYIRNPVLLAQSMATSHACFSRATLPLLKAEKNWALCLQREQWLHCP
jgi:hypothetical protein